MSPHMPYPRGLKAHRFGLFALVMFTDAPELFWNRRPLPMRIGMRLYLAPDSDLRAFAGAPRTLRKWLRFPRSVPEVSLDEHWQDLDAILAAATTGPSRSPFTPQGADWTYPFVADHGAYALSSTSTEDLLHSTEQVGRPEVEAYVLRKWAARAHSTECSPDLTPAELASRTEELLVYVARLREACALAVSKRYGVLMARWEES